MENNPFRTHDLSFSFRRPLLYERCRNAEWVVALFALETTWSTLRQDHRLSNHCWYNEVQSRLDPLRRLEAEKRGISQEQVAMADMEALLIRDRSSVAAGYDEIITGFGATDIHLQPGTSLRVNELSQMRNELLEKSE